WSLWGFSILVLAAAMFVAILNRHVIGGGLVSSYVMIVAISLCYTSAGALIASRVRGNPIGWILIAMGLALGLGAFTEQYVLRGLVVAPGSLPVTGFMAWLGNWIYELVVLPVAIVFLLF